MAATDLDDLNNWEYHWETAAVTFLNDATGVDVYRTVIEDDLELPRIEIQFEVEDALEPAAPRNGGTSASTIDYRAFNANFQVRIATDNATGGASSHAGYRSKIRTALMRSASNWNSTNLEYYDLKNIRLTSVVYDAEGDINVTQMNYAIVWEIRNDAWP